MQQNSINLFTNDDALFDDSRRDIKNQYSTFIEELQESTEKLMNEVFNTQYIPDINCPEDQDHNKMNSLQQSNKKKGASSWKSGAKFNSTQRTSTSNHPEQLSQSFMNFLKRNDKWKQRRLKRAEQQGNKKQQDQVKGLNFVPTILRASKQKIEPIYERCLELQKDKEKKLAIKRIEQQKKQNKKQSEQYTFQPKINNTKEKNRTLQQYLRDKQQWNNKKRQFIENSKIIGQARKYQQCLFHPILVTKNYKPKKNNNRAGQKVQDRLIRTLEKKYQQKMNE